MSDVKVSVVCTVYNHENYLRQTLDSFVNQKTSFGFEILVHDDASTDNSAAIIREYEKKYPEMIKPIYQTKNQFSLVDEFHHRLTFSKTQGKYIAFCEGDDCWIDDNKLQKQYDLLESRQDVDICVHNARMMSLTKDYGKIRISNAKEEVIPFEEIVKETRGAIPTASIMLRKEVVYRPEVVKLFDVLCIDLTIVLVGALRGGALCISDFMSVYHVDVEGSWTSRNAEKGNSLALLYWQKEAEVLPMLMAQVDDKKKRALDERLTELRRRCLLMEKKYYAIIKDRKIYKSLKLKTRVHLWLNVLHIGGVVEAFLNNRKTTDVEGTNARGISSYCYGYGTYPPDDSIDQ